MNLALYNTVESKVFTNKTITEMTKTIKWIKKLKLSQGFIR